jgi:hypothetical protein
MPRGSLPSMAALTKSGARNASEIVMLTFRALQPSRFAILSTLAVGSVVSSSSQRRPRAIDATSVARVSERIGRESLGDVGPDDRTSRRRVEAVLCQGTWMRLSDLFFGRLVERTSSQSLPNIPTIRESGLDGFALPRGRREMESLRC